MDEDMIKILLADDQPLVRQGLRMRLKVEQDFEVVGEAGDGYATLKLAEQLAPDVVILDVEMPGLDGLAAAEALRKDHPQMTLIILSIHDDPQVRARAAQAGANAFLSKRTDEEALLEAIRQSIPPGQIARS
jgi:DNA-binding NarL/FixJ family response regulator